MNALQQDTILLGYIYGGINSSQLNPFSSNQTSTTSASSVAYKVWLTRNSTSIEKLPRTSNWHPLTIFPNPAKESIRLSLGKNLSEPTFFYLLDSTGKMADSGSCSSWEKQEGLFGYTLPSSIASQQLELIVITSDNNMWSCSFLKN
jgi:hypothetical protein